MIRTNLIMKAPKILIAFFCILLVGGLASGQPAHESSDFKPDSEPDGFRGIKWGTDISTLKDMTLVMIIDKDTKRYKRNGDVLKMGEMKLTYIHYEFWKGIFYLVDIGCEGVENWNKLRSRIRRLCFRFPENVLTGRLPPLELNMT